MRSFDVGPSQPARAESTELTLRPSSSVQSGGLKFDVGPSPAGHRSGELGLIASSRRGHSCLVAEVDRFTSAGPIEDGAPSCASVLKQAGRSASCASTGSTTPAAWLSRSRAAASTCAGLPSQAGWPLHVSQPFPLDAIHPRIKYGAGSGRAASSVMRRPGSHRGPAASRLAASPTSDATHPGQAASFSHALVCDEVVGQPLPS